MDQVTPPATARTAPASRLRWLWIGVAIGSVLGHQARHLLALIPAGCGTLDVKDLRWDGRRPLIHKPPPPLPPVTPDAGHAATAAAPDR